MTATSYRTLAYFLAVSLAVPHIVWAQTTPSAPPAQTAAGTPAPSTPAAPVFRTEEIDQMVAAIALYPDQLLVQIFMASTYPLEVVQAERWVSDAANAKLKGDALDAALQNQTWDPSVKSLVPFPPVLKMMSDKLDWTQRLGDAFLAQEKDVMAAVQRLRREAQANGNLESTPQQIVSIEPAPQATGGGGGSSPPPEVQQVPVSDQQTIIIQPADPQTVYVPTYDPSTVYGSWPYPSYPPYSYPPAPAYYPGYGLAAAGVGFLTGMAVGGALWGWGNANWNGGTVNINGDRYNNINSGNIRNGRATQLPANANNWRHDPSHRQGVAYRDQATRQNFQGSRTGQTAANRDFRGYDRAAAGSPTRQAAANRAGAGAPNRAGAGAANRPAAGAANRPGTGTATRPSGTASARAGAGSAGAAAGGGAGQRQAATSGATRSGASGGGAQRTQSAAGRGQSAASARQPAAFQGMGSGSQVRAQSSRGASSMQSFSSSSRASSAGSRSSSGGGGGARGGGGGGGGRGGGGGGGRR